MNSTALGALLSTGVNGIPPTTAMFARFHTGNEPGPPGSAPPRMNAGFLSAIWPAQRADVGGVPSVAQRASWTGGPPAPPPSAVKYMAADAPLGVVDVLARRPGGLAVFGERDRPGPQVEQADGDRRAGGIALGAE